MLVEEDKIMLRAPEERHLTEVSPLWGSGKSPSLCYQHLAPTEPGWTGSSD